MLNTELAATLLPHAFRLGPMRLTVYGAAAAAGVVACMGLSGRAARQTSQNAEAAWDVGLFAIMSCFIASRLLLVLRDPIAFVHFPLLVLGLPSLTYGGMALASVAVWFYLRRRQLPVVPMLDVFAPGAALLAAFLELGQWMEGTALGMPVSRHGGPVNLQPVALYGLLASILLCLVLWYSLRWGTGRAASLGLVLGGLAAFALNRLSLPSALFANWWLEPGDCIALASVFAGACLWLFVPSQGRETTRTQALV